MVYTIANTYDVFAIAFMVFLEQKNNYKLLYLFSIKPPHALPLLDMVLFWMWNVFFALCIIQIVKCANNYYPIKHRTINQRKWLWQNGLRSMSKKDPDSTCRDLIFFVCTISSFPTLGYRA